MIVKCAGEARVGTNGILAVSIMIWVGGWGGVGWGADD